MLLRRRSFLAGLLGTTAILAAGPLFAATLATPTVLGTAHAGSGSPNLSVTTGSAVNSGDSIFNFGVTDGTVSLGTITDSQPNTYATSNGTYGAGGLGHTQVACCIQSLGLALGGTVTLPSSGTANNRFLISIAIPGVVALMNPANITNPKNVDGTGTGPDPAARALDPTRTAGLNSQTALPHRNTGGLFFGFGDATTLALVEASGATTLTQVATAGGVAWASWFPPGSCAPIFYDPSFNSCNWICWGVFVQGPAPAPPAFPAQPPNVLVSPPTWGLLQNTATVGSPQITVTIPALFPNATPNKHIFVVGTQSPTYTTMMAAIGAEVVPLGGSLVPRIANAPAGSDAQQDVIATAPVGSAALATYAANVATVLAAALPYMGASPVAQLGKEPGDSGFYQPFGPPSQAIIGSISNDGTTTTLTITSGPLPTPGLSCILVGGGANTQAGAPAPATQQPATIISGSAGTYVLANASVPGGLMTVASGPMQWGTAQQIAAQTWAYYLGEETAGVGVCHSLGIKAAPGAILHYEAAMARWANLRAAGRQADADEIMAQMFGSTFDGKSIPLGLPNALRSDIGIFDYQPGQAIRFYFAPLVLAGLKGTGVDLGNWHFKSSSPNMAAPHDVLSWAMAQTGLATHCGEFWASNTGTIDPALLQPALLEAARLGLTFCSTTAGLANAGTGALTPAGLAASDVFAGRIPLPNSGIPSARGRQVRAIR